MVCIILIGLGKPKVCVYLFGIGEPIELLFKQGGRKENLIKLSRVRLFFLKPYLPPTEERVLTVFLVRFWVL